MQQKMRYLQLLSKQYQNRYAVYSKLINLRAILNMPKGTEHFISDIHGEYESFLHILNNASGVIKEKVYLLFDELSDKEKDDLCTLIYYPKEVIAIKRQDKSVGDKFYKVTIQRLVLLINFLSSKYSRSKVRKLMQFDFAFIIDELMHAKSDENNSKLKYHQSIINSLVKTGGACDFIYSLCKLIKRLSVDKLHVLGDIFDRGLNPDKCMDLLIECDDLDLQFGNHDVLWMGASCGSAICAINILCNNIRYNNFKMLENGYGISLRKIAMFAKATYKDEGSFTALQKAVSVICVKLIGQIVTRHPEYEMSDRLVLDNIDLKQAKVKLKDGIWYDLKTSDLPTINPDDPYTLTKEEQRVVEDLVSSFKGSVRLKHHVDFLFSKGTMYKCFNGNLLYHGCIPLDDKGNFDSINCNGKMLYGKDYLDYCEQKLRQGYIQGGQDNLDFFWYMWTGPKSPLSGRKMKLFERLLIKDESTHDEPRNPYYTYYYQEQICKNILVNFGLDPNKGHIINGHTPILVKAGESPIRGNGKLLVIDGGFCKAYQDKTGIAGYTLVYSSHKLELKAHTPFLGVKEAICNNEDISNSQIINVEEFSKRKLVSDTDKGRDIRALIRDLESLLECYLQGLFVEHFSKVSDDSEI